MELFLLLSSLSLSIYMQPADIQTGIQTAETDRATKEKERKEKT